MASDGMRTFSMPPYNFHPKEGDPGHGERVSDPGEVGEGGVCPARIADDEEAFLSASLRNGGNGAPSLPSMSGTTCEPFLDPFENGHAENDRCIWPTAASLPSVPPARPRHPSCCHSGTEFGNEEEASRDLDVMLGANVGGYGAGAGAADGPAKLLTVPHVLGQEKIEDAEDHEVGAPDWLDITHAMLDASHGSG